MVLFQLFSEHACTRDKLAQLRIDHFASTTLGLAMHIGSNDQHFEPQSPLVAVLSFLPAVGSSTQEAIMTLSLSMFIPIPNLRGITSAF